MKTSILASCLLIALSCFYSCQESQPAAQAVEKPVEQAHAAPQEKLKAKSQSLEKEQSFPMGFSQTALSWRFAKKDGKVIATNSDSRRQRTVCTDEVSEDGINSTTHEIVSFVGPLVTVVTEYYYEGGAHPSYGRYFQVFNAETGNQIRLTEIFPPAQLLVALKSDGVIRRAISTAKDPQSIRELIDAADGGCEMYIGDNLTQSFAFHHLKGNQVAVRIGLTHGCEAMRGKFTQLGLYLDVPKPWMALFRHAASQKSFMQTVHPKIASE